MQLSHWLFTTKHILTKTKKEKEKKIGKSNWLPSNIYKTCFHVHKGCTIRWVKVFNAISFNDCCNPPVALVKGMAFSSAILHLSERTRSASATQICLTCHKWRGWAGAASECVNTVQLNSFHSYSYSLLFTVMNSMKTCNSVTLYFMKNSFSDISRKCIWPNW